jgi:hypothetical protein
MGITWLETGWTDAVNGDVAKIHLQIAYDDTDRAGAQWLLESPMFQQWLEELKRTPYHSAALVPDQHVFSTGMIQVSEIKILHVQPFGPCSGERKAKEGMAYLSVTAEYVMPGHTFAERYRVPNLVFLRPNATAVLLVETDGTESIEEGAFGNATVANVIAVEQFRTPAARTLMELIAGQVSGDVFSIASKEVAEETGGAELEIRPEHAVQTGGIYPSGGGCSEQLQRVFVVVKGGVKLDRLSRQASGTVRGVGGNERVKTVRVDLAELLGDCAAKTHPLWADAKFHIAFPTLRDRYPALVKAVCRK